MSRNILFEHNQKAYNAAVSMMEETGKAAVIHPTGTGKSAVNRLSSMTVKDSPHRDRKILYWFSALCRS